MAGALWLLHLALGAAAQEPIAGWLPEETLFCLSVEDPPRTAERLARGRYARLRGDPAAQRIAIEARALLARAREASHDRGDAWLGPFWSLARGPILLAVVRAGGRESPLVVMDTGDPAAFPRHLARLAGAGVLGPEARRECHGETIRWRHGGEGAGAVFWTGRGGVVAFSWRVEALEELLDHRGSGGAGFASRLDAVRAKLRGDADVLLLLPREAIAELARRDEDVAELALPRDASLGMTITLDPDALDVRAFLFAKRPREGVLAFLDEPNGEVVPPPFLAGGTFVAARFDLVRVLELAGVRGDETPLVKPFVRALGDRFALARVGGDEVFLAAVANEARMRRVLSALPDAGGGVREAPDGAVAMRGGWLIAAERPRAVWRLLAEPVRAPPAPSAALPRDRILLWRVAPGAPLDWDDPMRLFAAQEGALVNDADGLLLVHRVALR
jgi:hypothetical protein